MFRIVENLKSLILTGLIVLSIVLTGSLWFDNYQGLSLVASTWPTNLVSKFSGNENYSIIYDDIILPHKVTVVNPDKNKWIFYKNDNMSITIWKIIKNRLNSITNETEIITGRISEWNNLIDRKSVILEFGGTIEYEILRLVIPNLDKESNAFNNVEKIALTKSLEGNTIYILQNDNDKKYLYKILLKGEDQEIENFMNDCENIKTYTKYLKLSNLGTTKFFGGKEVIADKTVLFPVANTYNRRNLVYKLKNNMHFNLEDEYEIGRFVLEVFNSTDFAKFVTNDSSNIFINDDKSSIKFEKNGVIEYLNNGKIEDEIVSASKEFNFAMEFISSIRVYDEIYLSSAKEDEGVYTFKFSISKNGIPIGFLEPVIGENNYDIIEIKVKNEDIIYFKGKLLDLELTNNSENVSNFSHNILDAILGNVPKDTKINISNIDLMYVLDNEGSYYPSWVTKYNTEKDSERKSFISVVKK